MQTSKGKSKKGATAPVVTATEIIVLVDRSGSMATIKDDMENGYQSFMDEQRKNPDGCTVTLVTFDTQSTDVIHEAMPVATVPRLVLVPRGGTPLLDACGQTINRAAGRMERSTTRPDKVLFLVITDGYENSSREFDKKMVRDLIVEQEKAGWIFSFLGANQDAFAEGGKLGVSATATANYIPDSVGVKHAFAAIAVGASMLRSGGTYSVSNRDVRVRQHQEPAAVTMGRSGGAKGGAARAKSLTPTERSEAAKKAVNARWRKAGL